MSRVDLAHIARREPKICGHAVDKLELRDDIVANRMVWPSRSRGEVRQLLPPMPAFHHESTYNDVPGREILRSSPATFSPSNLLDLLNCEIDADFCLPVNGIRA